MSATGELSLAEDVSDFLRRDYRAALSTLARRYPREQQSLEVSFSDLHTWEPDVANDLLDQPGQIQPHLDEALRLVDLPADVSLSGACVRVVDLPDDAVHYPGHFSPTERSGEYLGIRGEVVMTSDVRPKIVEAAFECERCGTTTRVPQTGDGFQEPHECHGCERQGPFRVDHDRSDFVDSQTVVVQEPPSVAGGGGRDINAVVEGELTDTVGVGDEVVVTGTLHLKQRTQGRTKMPTFDSYLDAQAIQIESQTAQSLDITSEERQRIRDLAAGAEGDPIDVAAESLSTKVLGYDHIKRAIILGLVGGHRVTAADGSVDRGDFHILLLGDPGTAKSKLGDRAEAIAPRAVGVSGKNATAAGLTASAVRDELNEGQWTLGPGAFVKGNNGLVWIDELDDMDPDVRASMLEPMSKQTINVSKAGINANLSTRTAVIAAGNPKYGRFDRYEPIASQFDFDSALLSRFDLIFTLSDQPDPDEDVDIAMHIADHRETAKRLERGEDVSADLRDQAQPPVESDILTKWIALAKQQPAPVVADQDVKREKAEAFATLRGANGYDDDSPIPTTFRKWEAVYRIAEAAARFELSEEITERHFEVAMELIGRSMRDYGKDEDGNFDTDVVETGASKKTTDTKKLVEEILKTECDGETPRDEVVSLVQAEDEAISETAVNDALDKLAEGGFLSTPKINETVKWIGRY